MYGANQSTPATATDAKKKRKNKVSKRSSKTSKKSKPNKAAAIGPTPKNTEREAQNEKWKAIRTEVLAHFFGSKKNNSNGEGTKTFDKDVLRGITVRPSGKYQAQLYFGGRSRYIGVFNSEYEAASAYEMIRSRLKKDSNKNVCPTKSSPTPFSVTADANSEEGKDTKTTVAEDSEITRMRSITPSPTPRVDGPVKAVKIAT